MKTTEVINIRFVSGIKYAITIRTNYTPGWISSLFGSTPWSRDDVYIGHYVWHNAASGQRVGLFFEDWLGNTLRGHLAVEQYKRDGQVN